MKQNMCKKTCIQIFAAILFVIAINRNQDEGSKTGCWIMHLILVQFSSVTQSCPTLCNPMNCNMPGLPVHHQLPESTQIHVIVSAMTSNHLILCRPLLLLSSIFPSIRVFSNESALHIRWTKVLEFQLQHQSLQ